MGSGLYEVGYLMAVQRNEHGEFYFAKSHKDIALENSNNIDLSLRKHSGNLGFVVNAFFNRVDNFYYLNNTGFTKLLEEGMPSTARNSLMKQPMKKTCSCPFYLSGRRC